MIKRVCFTLLLVLVAALALAEESSPRLAIIVHPERSVTLDSADVAQIFLKRRRFWSDGDPIVPINRDGGSSDREAFTRRVFGNQARRLADYWNRQYFLGVLPPATLASDEAVKRFVAIERNAVGYIRADLIDPSVKVAFFLDVR